MKKKSNNNNNNNNNKCIYDYGARVAAAPNDGRKNKKSKRS
jgi:hypothetical protein